MSVLSGMRRVEVPAESVDVSEARVSNLKASHILLTEVAPMRRLAILLVLAVPFALVLAMPFAAFAQSTKSPTTLRGVLLEQLHTTHDQEDWFVPANVAVAGLTAEQAKWSPGKGNHSIGQLAPSPAAVRPSGVVVVFWPSSVVGAYCPPVML